MSASVQIENITDICIFASHPLHTFANFSTVCPSLLFHGTLLCSYSRSVARPLPGGPGGGGGGVLKHIIYVCFAGIWMVQPEGQIKQE